MHTAHIVLVRADDHEDAISTVQNELFEPDYNWCEWSDWAVVVDGRYRLSNFFEPNTYTGVSEYAVSYDTERVLFDKVLGHFMEVRRTEFNRILDRLELAGKGSLGDYDLEMLDTHHAYDLLGFAQLVTGSYTYDSYVYDLNNQTANLSVFRSIPDKSDWFAVLVDFHF